MKKVLVILLTLFAITSFAADEAGRISKYQGRILLYDGVSPRAQDVTSFDTPVYVKNKVTTKQNSTAVVELISGDKVALSEKIDNEY